MEKTKTFNHEFDNPMEALGVDKERIKYILLELEKRLPIFQTRSEVFQTVIKLCNCPEEILILSYYLGNKDNQNICKECPGYTLKLLHEEFLNK